MQDEVTSEAPTRQKTRVAIEDQKTYILAAGRWAGLGAIQKVNEVHVNVSGTAIGGLLRIDCRFPAMGTLVASACATRRHAEWS